MKPTLQKKLQFLVIELKSELKMLTEQRKAMPRGSKHPKGAFGGI